MLGLQTKMKKKNINLNRFLRKFNVSSSTFFYLIWFPYPLALYPLADDLLKVFSMLFLFIRKPCHALVPIAKRQVQLPPTQIPQGIVMSSKIVIGPKFDQPCSLRAFAIHLHTLSVIDIASCRNTKRKQATSNQSYFTLSPTHFELWPRKTRSEDSETV